MAKLTKEILLLYSVGFLVLEVALDLPLTVLLCPARPRVFMCQRALFCRGTELNINSPRHTMLARSRKTRENKTIQVNAKMKSGCEVWTRTKMLFCCEMGAFYNMSFTLSSVEQLKGIMPKRITTQFVIVLFF